MTIKDNVQSALDQLAALMAHLDDYRKDSDLGGTISADVVFERIEAQQKLAEAHVHLQHLMLAVDVEYERKKAPVRMCLCKDVDGAYDISECSIHTIDHVFRTGCCDQPEGAHRQATTEELTVLYPKVYDKRVVVGDSTYRVDAHRSTDHGVWVTLTQLFKGEEDDSDGAGLCFDLSLDALIATLPLMSECGATLKTSAE